MNKKLSMTIYVWVPESIKTEIFAFKSTITSNALILFCFLGPKYHCLLEHVAEIVICGTFTSTNSSAREDICGLRQALRLQVSQCTYCSFGCS